jgi:hypothetical protein
LELKKYLFVKHRVDFVGNFVELFGCEAARAASKGKVQAMASFAGVYSRLFAGFIHVG